MFRCRQKDEEFSCSDLLNLNTLSRVPSDRVKTFLSSRVHLGLTAALILHPPVSPPSPLPVHGSVLVYLQSGGIQSQPRPSFSCDPQTPQIPKSAIRYSVQRPAVCLHQQIRQINTQSTARYTSNTSRIRLCVYCFMSL